MVKLVILINVWVFRKMKIMEEIKKSSWFRKKESGEWERLWVFLLYGEIVRIIMIVIRFKLLVCMRLQQ
jgi:hypothetical protein